jgi:hypothetical protein
VNSPRGSAQWWRLKAIMRLGGAVNDHLQPTGGSLWATETERGKKKSTYGLSIVDRSSATGSRCRGGSAQLQRWRRVTSSLVRSRACTQHGARALG